MDPIIAVHCGAGSHSPLKHPKYNKLSKKACKKAIEALRNGASALEAVKIAISEDDPMTNCAYGSNLTIDGTVEMDASIMDGKTLLYGGCGAVTNVKNPIDLAYNICVKQLENHEFGLVPPSCLVGKGARLYAKALGLKITKNKSLISPRALSQFNKYKQMVQGELLDTVGAVCLDREGHVAAGCSSGGILLKKSGRLGQGAVYASGVWADSYGGSMPIAVCTSGCGEHLIRTQLAKSIAEDLQKGGCPTVGLSDSMKKQFLENVSRKLCGALVLYKNGDTTSVLWGHTTETMSVGYMRSSDDKPKALVSQLPPDVAVGTKVSVSGVHKYSKD